MENEWSIDSNESDVLIKSRHSLLGYMPGNKDNFKGHVAIQNDELEDASIEFYLKGNDENETPVIQFKSTSFQKINKSLNFLKGFLTIKNVTKVVELETEFIGYNNYNGVQKASFEVIGNFNRKEFGLNSTNHHTGQPIGKDIKLVANLEFSH